MKKKVAIIGAGIAGLTLAVLLKAKSDFDFIIYEKEDFLNLEDGYGIQLSVNSVSILNKIGFDQLNKKEKYFPSKLDFYSTNYNKICDLDLTEFNSENTKYTTLKRSTLISFLKGKLFSNSLMFRKKINKIEEVEEKININFVDGSTSMVDYLIISDGVFSNTKSIIEKKVYKPHYHGSIAIRSQVSVKDIPDFDSNNISIIMGNNAHLVLYPVNKEKEINLICIIRSKSETNNSIKTILENTILKENKNLINLFNGELKSWPIYTSDKPIKSIYKNVLYIGDAFYTFLPTMAQGASQSIEAANEICELMNNNNKDIQNKYLKQRLEKTNLVNKRSELNYFGFHITNPLLKNLRNFLLKKLVKNKNFIQSYLGKIYR
tara:strand:+ start:1069 stop:2199 length:1131 start_codon:yes stop_codon:yes gene_type:complete